MWHDGLEVKHERTRTEAGGRLAAPGQRGTCCCVGASQHPVSCERAPAVRVTSSCMSSSFSALPKAKLKIYIFCENLPEQWHTVNFSICQAWHRMMNNLQYMYLRRPATLPVQPRRANTGRHEERPIFWTDFLFAETNGANSDICCSGAC